MVGGAGAAAALPRHAGVVPTRPESARPLLVSYRPVADVLECAGLAGFSVAHVLAKAGHNVRVLEKLPALGAPAASSKADAGAGVRAVVLAPTRELAHQIHNECLKLAQGRKWRVVLFSKATAATLADKNVRDKIGERVQLGRMWMEAHGAAQTSSSARL